MFERGLYFKTESEAERCIKENILLVKLHQWAKMKNDDWRPTWKDRRDISYAIYYDVLDDSLDTYCMSITNNMTILPVFKTKEIAEECIDLFGDEIIETFCNKN